MTTRHAAGQGPAPDAGQAVAERVSSERSGMALGFYELDVRRNKRGTQAI